MRWAGQCPDCGGCIDDNCRGCSRRFCGGTYLWMQWGGDGPEAEACDRCPLKVDKQIHDPRDNRRSLLIKVRCNGDAGHDGRCHWDPWKVGR